MPESERPARYWIETLGLSPHPEGGYYALYPQHRALIERLTA